MRRLPAPLLVAAMAVLSVPLVGCAGDHSDRAELAAPPAGQIAADDLQFEQALDPVTAAPPTTTTIPPTTSTTTSTTTEPPPPPTTVTTAPPAPPAPVAAAAATPPPPPPAPQGGDEARALQLVNQERARAGLAALQVNGGARAVARAWSTRMAGSGLAHNPDLGGDLARAGVTAWAAIGENVGYAGSVDQVHGLFMGSGGHRANILNGAYSQVGIGVVRSGGTVWVTLAFVGY